MGSGRLVGGFEGWRGATDPAGGAFVQPGSLMAGGSAGWDQPILNGSGGGGGCTPIDLHADGTTGTFTLTNASANPNVLLATFPYDFSCSSEPTIDLHSTVDNAFVSGVTPAYGYPLYGIFIVTVVPPLSHLFTLVLPDVQMLTVTPVDTAFHTYTANHTIPNPGGPRTVIFAVASHEDATFFHFPVNYKYKNFILDVT